MPSEDEARNLAPRSGRFWAYLCGVTAVGLALTAVMLARLTLHDLTVMGGAFYGVAALLVLSELRPLVTAGSPDENGVSESASTCW